MTKRYEIIARMEQNGPFHLFFTLSCAEKRWPENFVSILKQQGKHIRYEVDQETNETKIMVGDITLEEYLENENITKMMAENVLTVARNFDKRMRAFLNTIILSKHSPMKVKHYTYR